MRAIGDLDDQLYNLSDELVESVRALNGDILVLGAGGKMGPSLARLARKAMTRANAKKKVIAVSRFSDSTSPQQMQDDGVDIISADLMSDEALESLPDAENIVYMAGTKFGTTGNEHHTWAMNAYLPGRVAERFKDARIVVFSTGNVYPLSPVQGGGSKESDTVGPVGEYAQSCLGRERVFEHFSHRHQTKVLFYRLNYAIDLRYGVLLEIAKAVRDGSPINLAMGFVNVIWQGDANQVAIMSLKHCSSPPEILNVTGGRVLAVRWIAEEFGKIFRRGPLFQGEEQSTALLSDASKMEKWFPFGKVSVEEMINMTAEWLNLGGPLLNKPTHFQERSGKF